MNHHFREPRAVLPGASSSRSYSGSRTGPLPPQDLRRGAAPITGPRLPGQLGPSSASRIAGQTLGAGACSQTAGAQVRRTRPGPQPVAADSFTFDELRRPGPGALDASAQFYSSRAVGSRQAGSGPKGGQRDRSHVTDAGRYPAAGSAGSVGNSAVNGQNNEGHMDFGGLGLRPPGGSAGSAGSGRDFQGSDGRGRSGPAAGPELPKVVQRKGLQELDPQRAPQKRFSCKSEDILGRLGEFEEQFLGIDVSIRRIAEGFHSAEVTPGKARDDLAQLEALLDKLQFNGVDSIDTYELESGKEHARSLRKELTRQAEELHGRMEALFKEIRQSSLAGGATIE